MQQELPVIASAQDIQQAVKHLATQVSQDYQECTPLALGVLKGCFVFMAYFVRELSIPVEIEFIRLSSYGASLKSSGKLRLVSAPVLSLKGRDVLLVEDIVDKGYTIQFLRDYCQKQGASSARLCALFVKGQPDSYPFPIEYYGLQIPDRFVVGYGIDAREQYRYLRDLRAVTIEKETTPL